MQLFHYKQVSSTQDLAKEYLIKGEIREPAVFIADSQTAGYGKQGRKFYSPADTGIYFSLAIPNFKYAKNKVGLLTPFIATKMVEVLAQYFPTFPFQIKWVNDLYLNRKKIAGILTEIAKNGLVIGIGLNLNTQTFPDNLKEKAASINQDVDKDKLTIDLINEIQKVTQDYIKADFLNKYRKLSCVIGNKIELKEGRKVITGIAENIDERGRLIVSVNGKPFAYASGEIDKVNFISK